MISSAWFPQFTLIPAIARGLMQIEAARALVDRTPLTPAAEAELRARARVRAAHFSISLGAATCSSKTKQARKGSSKVFAAFISLKANYFQVREWAIQSRSPGTPSSQ